MLIEKINSNRRSLVLVATIGISLFAVARLTMLWLIPNYEEALETAERFDTDREAMQLQIDIQQARIALLEQEVKVVREANRQLMLGEQKHQDEIAALREDLRFYQRLAAAGGSNKGLAVHSLQLHPTQSSQVFRFILTLTQNLKKAAMVKGVASFKVLGVESDHPVALDWSVLRLEESKTLNFEFKFFQQLEGRISLPPGFEPDSISITLNQDQQEMVFVQFEWSEALQKESFR